MSQYQNELCCLIIEDFYGEFYSSIYANLLWAGRCSAGQLAQKSRLPLRQIKSGLASLVQLRLVFHHTTNGSTMYQANLNSAYNILRCGKLADLARFEHGDLAGDIIAEACLFGFGTASELCGRLQSRNSSLEREHINGIHANAPNGTSTRTQIFDMIQKLRVSGYLLNARSAQLQTDFDVSQDIASMAKFLELRSSVKGRKGLLELEAKIEAEKRKRQSPTGKEYGYIPDQDRIPPSDGGEEAALKQRNNTSAQTTKHVNGVLANGSDNTHDATLIAVDYSNIARHTRDMYVADLTKKMFGERYSRVMRSALLQVPTTRPWLEAMEGVSLDITKLCHALSITASTNGHSEHHVNGNGIHNNSSTENVFSYGEIEQILKLFTESPFEFIESSGEVNDWKINKQVLDIFLQEREILRLVEDRLGSPALRIVRMLIVKGKLDEKTLQETGLLGAKELRQILADLKQMGFIDLQEVPREAQRQPNRTIFLWFHDLERVRKLLLENLYKAMSRLMQRLKLERSKLSATLEKVERSDVQGSEEQILSPPELKVLRRLQRTEEWLLGEMARLDESVIILRDL